MVLYVLSEGSAEFLGERFTSTLEWDKARAVPAVSMGASQAMNTVLKLSHEWGIGAREMYAIARSPPPPAGEASNKSRIIASRRLRVHSGAIEN